MYVNNFLINFSKLYAGNHVHKLQTKFGGLILKAMICIFIILYIIMHPIMMFLSTPDHIYDDGGP